jgi:hypothetical protein
MKMAYVLFDKMTSLDFVGFYEAVSWLRILNIIEDVSWDLCATKEEVTDDLGMTIKVKLVYPDLSKYDLIFIPGGMSNRELRYDSNNQSISARIADTVFTEVQVTLSESEMQLGMVVEWSIMILFPLGFLTRTKRTYILDQPVEMSRLLPEGSDTNDTILRICKDGCIQITASDSKADILTRE